MIYIKLRAIPIKKNGLDSLFYNQKLYICTPKRKPVGQVKFNNSHKTEK